MGINNRGRVSGLGRRGGFAKRLRPGAARRPTILLLLLLLLGVTLTGCGSPQPREWDDPALLATLVQQAQLTRRRIEQGQANFAWTKRIFGTGPAVEVTNVLSGNRLNQVIYMLQQNGGRAGILSLTVRDGVWYAHETSLLRGRYRPFEAPFGMPSAYLLLALADLQVIEPGIVARFREQTDEHVVLRLDLPPELKQSIQAKIDALLSQRGAVEQAVGVWNLRLALANLRQTLKTGRLVRVDRATGVLLDFYSPGMGIETTLFNADYRATTQDFDVSGADWADLTHDPTAIDDRTDLMMIANSPYTTLHNLQHMPSAMDQRLVNLHSRELRRIPFQGVAMGEGAFSHDRRQVYLMGLELGQSSLGLYRIDLSSGEQQRLDHGQFPDGVPMKPVLSGDGAKLAVHLLMPSQGVQVCVLDLATDQVRVLGAPRLLASGTWLDDDSGLVVQYVDSIAAARARQFQIARLDLQGNLRLLTPGMFPQVIPRSGRILYQLNDAWHTCDLDGQNVELYAKGMKDCLGPTCSPDGQRLLWLRQRPEALPMPVLQLFGRTRVKELDLGPGRWGGPIWR